MFSMKKLLKKICMFGVSAATTLSFCQPVVKGRPPEVGDMGQPLGPVNIAKNMGGKEAVPWVNITLNGVKPDTELKTSYSGTALIYNGELQQLISSVDSVKLGDFENGTELRFEPTTGADVQQVKVYLRVGNSSDAVPTSKDDWVEYKGKESLKNSKLMRREAKNDHYYVFYYVDGLTNVRDIGAGADGWGNGSGI